MVRSSPPTAGLFGVFNAYNRVTTTGLLGDSVSTYTYASTTIRECHGDTTYNIQFVLGLQEDPVTATSQQFALSATTGDTLLVGIGVDSTSLNSGLIGRTVGTASTPGTGVANYSGQLLGFHTISCNESVTAAATITASGSVLGAQTGMVVTLRN